MSHALIFLFFFLFKILQMTLVRALKDKNMHCAIKQIRKSPDKCFDVSGR